MDLLRKKIYLAALLHDIGKFYQRSDNRLEEENHLNKNTKKLSDYITRLTEEKKIKWQHVLWTNQFFEDNISFFNGLREDGEEVFKINPFNTDLHNENNIQNLAVYHHRPATKEQAIIQLADWYSSGIDRRNMSDLIDDDHKSGGLDWGKSGYKKIPMQSIFPVLRVNGKSSDNLNWFYKLAALNLDESTILPGVLKQEGIIRSLQTEYNELWKKFSDEFKKLPIDTIDGFLDTLLFILRKYTWCIPSSTIDFPSVSLFDHLKSTAAIADCLYEFDKEKKSFKFDYGLGNLTYSEDIEPFILLCCDISGIQNFIYDIHSSKAAVSLKGRSFYLQLLIESIIQNILKNSNIQANYGNVIYSSGGKCYIILPNTKKVKDAITEIEQNFEEKLWNETRGGLYAAFGFAEFGLKILEKNKPLQIICSEKNKKGESVNDLGGIWGLVSEKAARKKSRKNQFQLEIPEKFNCFFNPTGIGYGGKYSSDNPESDSGNYRICAVTGEEIEGEVKNLHENDPQKPPVFVSENVFKQAELGKVLKDFDYLITFKDISHDGHKYLSNRNKTGIEPAKSGIHSYLFDQTELTLDDADFRKIHSADFCAVERINNTDFLFDSKIKGNKASYGFCFYGGNEQAYSRDEFGQIKYEGKFKKAKDFEGLTKHCWKENGEIKSDTYLGILRADVDNLGQIFKNGLDEKNKSFSAYSTLSFQLDLFFSGYLNTIRNSNEFRDYVNIIYSGGDDVFAVGRWDKIIDFAEKIRTDFNEFVGGRQDISISCGVAVVNNKFPVSKAAQMAFEAEEKAKKYERTIHTDKAVKNAIHFLGETIGWEEFEIVKKLKDKFIKYRKDHTLSSGFLQMIMKLRTLKDIHEEMPGKEKDLSYIWKTAYYIGKYINDKFRKNEKKEKSCQEKIDFLEELNTKICSNEREYELAALASRWTELILRFNLHK